MKKCSKCKIGKELDEFGNFKNKNNGKTYKQSSCKKCKREARDSLRKSNPIKEALRKRKQRIRHKYGIELTDYEEMYNNQKGCCKICNNPLDKLNIDHCHESKKVRGLLCYFCNTGLGLFKDSIKNLLSAAEYLKDSNTDKSK